MNGSYSRKGSEVLPWIISVHLDQLLYKRTWIKSNHAVWHM